MSEEIRTISLEQAFRWECLDCKKENFSRAQEVTYENPFEEEQAKEKLGIPDDVEGAFVEAPNTVTCIGCFAMFDTDI